MLFASSTPSENQHEKERQLFIPLVGLHQFFQNIGFNNTLVSKQRIYGNIPQKSIKKTKKNTKAKKEHLLLKKLHILMSIYIIYYYLITLDLERKSTKFVNYFIISYIYWIKVLPLKQRLQPLQTSREKILILSSLLFYYSFFKIKLCDKYSFFFLFTRGTSSEIEASYCSPLK